MVCWLELGWRFCCLCGCGLLVVGVAICCGFGFGLVLVCVVDFRVGVAVILWVLMIGVCFMIWFGCSVCLSLGVYFDEFGFLLCVIVCFGYFACDLSFDFYGFCVLAIGFGFSWC